MTKKRIKQHIYIMKDVRIQILIVDDDYNLHEQLRVDLRAFLECYQAEAEIIITASIQEAFKYFSHHKIHLIVLDPTALNYQDDLIADLRQARDMPIIVFSQEYTAQRRIHYLKQGADLVLPKPVEYEEYFLSLSQLLRRYYCSVKQLEYMDLRTRFKNLEINPLQQSVRFMDKLLPITKKEFDVLWLFMNHPGQILTKEFIYISVWETDLGDSYKSVTDIIYRIRKKFSEGFDDEYLETIYGTGYRFARSMLR